MNMFDTFTFSYCRCQYEHMKEKLNHTMRHWRPLISLSVLIDPENPISCLPRLRLL